MHFPRNLSWTVKVGIALSNKQKKINEFVSVEHYTRTKSDELEAEVLKYKFKKLKYIDHLRI